MEFFAGKRVKYLDDDLNMREGVIVNVLEHSVKIAPIVQIAKADVYEYSEEH